MYDLEHKGTIYVTGKIGSFVSFFISQIKRKIFIFYDTDDEAFLGQEEIEYYTKKPVYIFSQCIQIRYSKKKTREREPVFFITLFQMKNLSVFFLTARSITTFHLHKSYFPV